MWIPLCVVINGIVDCQRSTGFWIVSSLVASVVAPEPAGVESTVAVAQVVGDTGQVTVHTEMLAENPEDPHQRRCTSQVHGVHMLW